MVDKNIKRFIMDYNDWLQEQEQIFRKIKDVECPYYRITLATLKKLTPEHKNTFDKLVIKSNKSWDAWDQIFSKNDYKIKSKPKSIRGIDFKITKTLYSNLLSADSLFRYCNSKGLYLIRSHFNWMLKNGLITSIKIIDDKPLYSRYQLLAISNIIFIKKESLDYPNPTFFEGRQIKIKNKLVDSPGFVKTQLINWQDYLLMNKTRILNNNNDLSELILLLEAMDNLSNIVFTKAVASYKKIKIKDSKETRHKLKYFINDIENKAYKYYMPKFKIKFKEISDNKIKVWSHSILPAWAIRYNPLLQICNKLSPLLKILKSEEKKIQTIFKKDNDIKMANFYIDIINRLNYYLKISKVKDIINIEDLLAYQSDRKEKTCLICGEIFMPNLERKGGKPQLLCGKDNCKKEWSKKRQKKYRADRK